MSKEISAKKHTFYYLIGINALITVTMMIWISLTSIENVVNLTGLNESTPITGWVLAMAAVIIYAAYTLWAVPVIRTFVFEFSLLKVLSLPLAFLFWNH
ncbi:hypothetical protein GCM10008931_35670 [Oceanobacillus oncorhynchi subsp. oncorhynchi]|uniref:hypothetical protein n=1 Tax=Oceanobacillus oncorhynchi TaxID=545501 RepID=UPI0031DB19FF